MTTLIVEDQESERSLLAHYLRRIGCECDTAGDGREALAKVSARPYDVVFLDLVIPEIAGESVLTYLRTRHPRTTVVVCSAQDDEGIVQDLLVLGATAYLIKPFTAEGVRSLIREIENRRTRGMGQSAGNPA